MASGARPGLWAFLIDNSILLVIGAVSALLWANLHHHSYEPVAHALHFVVNDIGMVFFFALATKEILEATLPGGALASPREAGVPLLAAVGGMAVPASLYTLQATIDGRPELLSGWAIPCATDIAFSYMAARMIFPRAHPAIPFLLLLAIADDALGLVLLAVFYPSGPLSIVNFALFMIPALGVALWLKRRRVTNFWAYTLAGGGLSWAALFFGGVHPALALVPILPFMPHEKRDLGLFDEREHGLPDTMNRFEHWWRVPVQIVLFFFGLANAGVLVSSVGQGTWIVLSSLVVGKPLGILLFTFLAVRLGLRPPGGLSYLHTVVLGLAAGIGFTVALFFATAAFPPGPVLDEAKMGALLSFIAAPLAVLLGRAVGMHPKRPFDRPGATVP
ncbi:MAG TPA: Na+/H+ antiporter NhaA [Vicinamibacterales bacterium]|nr:Na+/H+ antiporter NhaA [Vicinamibacterales bacterium]